MRLVNPDTVLLSMGVASNAGSLDNVGRALDLSFPIIENILETKLQQGSVLDFFSPTPTSRQYRLSNIFVDTDSLVVRVSQTIDPLFDESDGVVVDPADYFLNTDNSTLTFRKACLAGEHTLSVAYDYGLGETSGVLDSPYWLQEAAVGVAIHILNAHPSSSANRKDKTVTNLTNSLFTVASQLLNAHRRPRLNVEFPTRTAQL